MRGKKQLLRRTSVRIVTHTIHPALADVRRGTGARPVRQHAPASRSGRARKTDLALTAARRPALQRGPRRALSAGPWLLLLQLPTIFALPVAQVLTWKCVFGCGS